MNANIHFAKTHLSKLIEQALAGEEVVIARAGKPLVRLTPVEPASPVEPTRSWLGSGRGKMWMADDFDAPMPDLEQAIEESYIFPPDSADGVRERAGDVLDFTSGPKKVVAAQ